MFCSLAQPGGNITGFTLGEFAMSGKLLGVLKQVAPQVSRITVIYYPQQVPCRPPPCGRPF
jgi:putative ABC transport system substrate-binding protein